MFQGNATVALIVIGIVAVIGLVGVIISAGTAEDADEKDR